MKRYFPIILIVIAAYIAWDRLGQDAEFLDGAGRSNDVLAEAFRNRTSDIQIGGVGNVVKILPDDKDGSRHQRFILALGSGQRLLVAHNIDLAERISGLQVGDNVAFYGEYEWNAKGGVIHWTHHDPQGRHVGGWLEHNGRKYE